jgi:hypothetical protein
VVTEFPKEDLFSEEDMGAVGRYSQVPCSQRQPLYPKLECVLTLSAHPWGKSVRKIIQQTEEKSVCLASLCHQICMIGLRQSKEKVVGRLSSTYAGVPGGHKKGQARQAFGSMTSLQVLS